MRIFGCDDPAKKQECKRSVLKRKVRQPLPLVGQILD